MASSRISFQLYSARKFPPVEAQLDTLAALGFDAVEPYAGVYETDPAAFRKAADKVGLKVPTAHFPLALLDSDRGKAIDQAKTLGVTTVVVPYLVPEARPKDVAGWKALGARLGEHAAALKQAGFGLAWHNHDFEYFALPDGSRPIEHLIGVPGVGFEIDIGWIVRAGADAKAEITRFPGKTASFHIKDVAKPGITIDDGWSDVGAGIVDWQGLWPSIAGAGSDLYILEHDNPSDWKAFASNSYTYLAGLAGRKA